MNRQIKKLKIVPMGDRVLLRPERETEEKRIGSVRIVLPESVSKEKSDRGKVVAVGEGRFEDGKLVPMRVKVGDAVIFSKYGYDEVKLDGEELYLVKEDSILAVIK
ncbi:co-chaperone GroES [Candidatus Parcubacteria bacterium]|nr:co-chaperone GroES [Candidatus Parcubacteria bacterium]